MKYLNTLLEDQEIKQEIRDRAFEFADRTGNTFLEEMKLDDDAQLMFTNHILALIKRIDANSFVEEIEEEMLSEVSKEAFTKAQETVGWLFEEASIEVNISEVFLVATHIEMAMQKTNNQL